MPLSPALPRSRKVAYGLTFCLSSFPIFIPAMLIPRRS